MMPNIDSIIRFEDGEMNDEEVIEFFQGMINSGVVWQMQGSYGRMAQHLINSGQCTSR